jgi:hypothetical protein
VTAPTAAFGHQQLQRVSIEIYFPSEKHDFKTVASISIKNSLYGYRLIFFYYRKKKFISEFSNGFIRL